MHENMRLEYFLEQKLTIPLESRIYEYNENFINDMLNRLADAFIQDDFIDESMIVTKERVVIDGKQRLITLILIFNCIARNEKMGILSNFLKIKY